MQHCTQSKPAILCPFVFFCIFLVFVTEFVGLFNSILERVNVSATHNSHKALLSLAFQTNSALLKELLGT